MHVFLRTVFAYRSHMFVNIGLIVSANEEYLTLPITEVKKTYGSKELMKECAAFSISTEAVLEQVATATSLLTEIHSTRQKARGQVA